MNQNLRFFYLCLSQKKGNFELREEKADASAFTRKCLVERYTIKQIYFFLLNYLLQCMVVVLGYHILHILVYVYIGCKDCVCVRICLS